MRKTTKITSMIVVVAYILSLFSAYATVYAADKIYDVDKVVECEDVIAGEYVSEVSDRKTSGKKYVVIEGAKYSAVSDIAGTDFSFKVNIPADGEYAVYARAIINAGSDSCYVKWDEGDWIGVFPSIDLEEFAWIKLASSKLTAGEHTFSWTRREQKASYDCFFITNDIQKLPDDAEYIDWSKGNSTPDPNTKEKMKSVKMKNGTVIVEAEDVSRVEYLASAIDDEKASGKKGISLNVDDRTTPGANAHGGIAFQFKAEKDGYYNVWARVKVLNGGQDSSFVSLAGKNYSMVEFKIHEDGEYYWNSLGNVMQLKAGEIGSVRLIPREHGAIVDKFLVTSNITFVPEGENPAPSGSTGGVVTIPMGEYPVPSITPPPTHPRVLLTSEDIDDIKNKMQMAEFETATAAFKELVDDPFDGNLPESSAANHNERKLTSIEAKAFDYAVNGNEESGRKAIDAIKNYMSGVTFVTQDGTRQMGYVLYIAAKVYDWCYPLLTEEDKEEIVLGCQIIAMGMEIGFPPGGQGSVTGHGSEAQLMRDWLAFAIATYDEYPDMYNYVAGRFFSEFVPARNYWYPSETQHQGTTYGSYRFMSDLWGMWLIYKMSGDKIYIDEAGKVNYQWIYTRRPDGQLMRDGDVDTSTDAGDKNTWRIWSKTSSILTANFYKDPIMKKSYLRDSWSGEPFGYGNGAVNPIEYLIVCDPEVGVEDVSQLPYTKYFGSPAGAMVARTGWNFGVTSPDVYAFMKISEQAAANHHHKDAGHFQIYYKGILASDSGYYESYGTNHDSNYNKQSIAHNTLAITSKKNPNGLQRSDFGEPKNLEVWNSGLYETGEVIGHEFGPDTRVPEYSYIAGDIAKAYDENVEEAIRSMIFMPTDNAQAPAAFVVFDKITTKETDSKKTFLLHMQNEPEINGNVSIITNKDMYYNGRLTNQTLLPANATYEKIGGEGKEYWFGGKNYPLAAELDKSTTVENGWGRIEISAPTGNATDYFLNVMYVSDADSTEEVTKAELIDTEIVTGAKIYDRVALFNKNKERTKETIAFDVSGEGEVKVNVAGLVAGTWNIKANGEEIGTQISSEDGGIIYFTAPAGSIEISYASTDANKTFETSEAPFDEGVAIMLNGNYLYSDVAPTVIDGRTLLPMRALFEALDATVTWDEASSTATAVSEDATIQITENQTTAYVNGNAVELDVPAMILGGRFVVPVRFVSEALGASVTWDARTSLVIISKEVPQGKKLGIENAITVFEAIQSGSDGTSSIYDTLDGGLSTYWGVEGKDGTAWGIYDFGSVKTLDKMQIAYHNGASRVYTFTLQVSEDGVTYTDVLTNAKSNGKSNALCPFDLGGVKARYVKYVGGGNTTNLWNSIKEIVFIESK